MDIIKTHKDLDVWKKSVSLVTLIYEMTKGFPKDELYGLTNQIRRSAVSIPSNIAEGSARKGNKEFAQFLYIGLGSLSELETQLIIATNLKYISSEKSEIIMNDLNDIRRMLVGLIKYVKTRT
jgi:four helix bundle protein